MGFAQLFWRYIGAKIVQAYDTADNSGTPGPTAAEPDDTGGGNRPVQPAVEIARSILSRLHCEATWDPKDDHLDSCDINYQGGHFVLRVWDNHPYALLMFPFFYAADPVDIDLVRSTVNRVNMESIFTRVVTSVVEQTGEVQCHVLVSVFLDADTPAHVNALRDAMNGCFSTRRDFEKYFREGKDAGDDDPQMTSANRLRDLFLLSEQAWSHHDNHLRTSPSTTDRFTLAEMLRRLLDWQDVEHVSMRIVRGTQVTEVADATDCLLADTILPPGGDSPAAGQTVVLLLTVRRGNLSLFNENIVAPQRPPCIVTAVMRVTHSDELADYVQVVLSHEAGQNGEVRSLQHPEMRGDAVTFTIARDKADDKSRHDEYRFVLADAHDKVEQGHADKLTDIQELLLANEDGYNEGYNLYWGEVYIRHERYAEALAHLLSVYEGRKRNFMRMPPRQKNRFLQVMFSIGLCYARLQQYEKAYFFLDAAAQTNQQNHIIELINCLVNSSDPRADQILANVMAHVQEQMNENEDDDEFDADAMQPFMRFINMRRAYLLIEQRQWQQAEELLNKMLADDATEDFAMNELAYMATVREAEKNSRAKAKQ